MRWRRDKRVFHLKKVLYKEQSWQKSTKFDLKKTSEGKIYRLLA